MWTSLIGFSSDIDIVGWVGTENAPAPNREVQQGMVGLTLFYQGSTELRGRSGVWRVCRLGSFSCMH